MNSYYVYIITNDGNRVLYVGVTSDLVKRIYEHRNALIEGFSKRYHLKKLVYFEETSDILSAIEREKKLKKWKKEYKISLVSKFNPEWKDLYHDIL